METRKKQKLVQQQQEASKINNAFNFTALPDSLSLYVLKFLSVPDLAMCAQVARSLNRKAKKDTLWKIHFTAHFRGDDPAPPSAINPAVQMGTPSSSLPYVERFCALARALCSVCGKIAWKNRSDPCYGRFPRFTPAGEYRVRPGSCLRCSSLCCPECSCVCSCMDCGVDDIDAVDDIATCKNCSGWSCGDCCIVGFCEFCETDLCTACMMVDHCDSCGRYLCGGCFPIKMCEWCDRQFCLECRGVDYCRECFRVCCEECAVLVECSKCADPFCDLHLHKHTLARRGGLCSGKDEEEGEHARATL